MNSGPGEPGKHNAKSLGGNSTMTTNNPHTPDSTEARAWDNGYSEGLARQADVIAEQIRSGTVHSAGDGCPTELRVTALEHAVDFAKSDTGAGLYSTDEVVDAAVKFLGFLEGGGSAPLPDPFAGHAEDLKTESGDDK